MLSYALWNKANTYMRRRERSFPTGKTETRAQYIARLRKTARRLPTSFVDKAIGDMAERCQRLYEAKGRHFEEGGKKRVRC